MTDLHLVPPVSVADVSACRCATTGADDALIIKWANASAELAKMLRGGSARPVAPVAAAHLVAAAALTAAVDKAADHILCGLEVIDGRKR